MILRVGAALLFVFWGINAFAQTNIKGGVTSSDNIRLAGATILLQNKKDSSTVKSTLSLEGGSFLIEDIPHGEYLLHVRYFSFDNFMVDISIRNTNKNLDLGVIKLEKSVVGLQEVVVSEEKVEFTQRGDTINYNVSSFNVKPFETVNELLNKLPGLEIEEGVISSQGEDVTEILVDGKPFFDDPQSALQQLQALDIKKIEIFDKQSDLAEFTGVNDGNDKKVINLILKEERKSGGFGKVTLYGGANDYYDLSADLNRFDRKLTYALSAFVNNNKKDFRFQGEQFSYGTRSFVNWQPSDKLEIKGRYRYYDNNDTYNKTIQSIEIIDTLQLIGFDSIFSNSFNNSHNFSLKLKYKENKNYEFVFDNKFKIRQSSIHKVTDKSLYQNEINKGTSSSDSEKEKQNHSLKSKLNYKKNFKRKGRNIHALIQFSQRITEDEDQVVVQNNFVNNELFINQAQISNSTINDVHFDMGYMEPLSKNIHLSVFYNSEYELEKPSKYYYDKSMGSTILNDDLSADFEKKIYNQIGGLNLKWNTKKVNFNIGFKNRYTILKGAFSKEKSIDRNYNLILPQLKFKYKLSKSQKVKIRVTTKVYEPKLNQLFSFRDNTSSDKIIEGNPELRPEISYKLHFNHVLFKSKTKVTLSNNLYFSYKKDPITNQVNIDNNLFKIVKPINGEDNYIASYSIRYSKGIKSLKLKFSVKNLVSFNYLVSIINNQVSQVENRRESLNINISNTNTKLIEFKTGIRIMVGNQKIKIMEDYNRYDLSISSFINTKIFLPNKWTVNSKFMYKYYQKDTYFDSPSQHFWSLHLSKLFLKEKLYVFIKANDIFNSFTGYKSQRVENAFSQSFTDSPRNLIQLGLSYKYGKKKK